MDEDQIGEFAYDYVEIRRNFFDVNGFETPASNFNDDRESMLEKQVPLKTFPQESGHAIAETSDSKALGTIHVGSQDSIKQSVSNNHNSSTSS